MDRELLLLGLLRREDMHGYQLHAFIEENMASCTDLKKSTAYYLLDKMTERGWLEPDEEQAGNRPARRVYRITPAGEAHFQRLLRHNLMHYHEATFTGNIGLAFMDELPSDEALALLKQRRDELQDLVLTLDGVPVHRGSLQLMIEHQQHHLHAELSWLNSLIDRLSAEADSRGQHEHA